MKPTDEAKRLRDEIATNTYAKHCDCGDVGFYVSVNANTGETEQEQCQFCYTENSYFNIDQHINKVLDAVLATTKKQPHYTCDVFYNSAAPELEELGGCMNEDEIINSINKLRP